MGRLVAEKYQHFGSIESPAACPKCGSGDLSFPYHGPRTRLWLSTCRDCGRKIRSVTQFEVTPPRRLRARIVREPDPQPMRPMATTQMAAAIAIGETVRLPYREPGEEG